MQLAALRTLDMNAEGAKGRDRCQGVFALEKTPYHRITISQGTEHHGAMRNRFVAGDADFTIDTSAGRY
jgi:hypothetical protein